MTSEGLIKLPELLVEASSGRRDAVEMFYLMLLESDVYIPIISSTNKDSANEVLASESPETFLAIRYDGNPTVPIFSDPSYITAWAREEIPYVCRRFSQVINLIPRDSWLYLDAGQEAGKEISPWEVERLLKGAEAIDEIVSDLVESGQAEMEVVAGRDVYPHLKRQLIAVLEIYPEVDEAFIVCVKDPETKTGLPVLGVKHGGLQRKQLQDLKSEIGELAAQHFDREDAILIVDDLADPTCQNSAVFNDVTPFYFAQKKLKKRRRKSSLHKVVSFFKWS